MRTSPLSLTTALVALLLAACADATDGSPGVHRQYGTETETRTGLGLGYS